MLVSSYFYIFAIHELQLCGIYIELFLIISNHKYLMIYLLIYKNLNLSIMPIVKC